MNQLDNFRDGCGPPHDGSLLRESPAGSTRSLLIDHIGELTTNEPALNPQTHGTLHNAALVMVGGNIAWVGSAAKAPSCDLRVDAAGNAVLPGWVDSHTHLLFAGDRTQEFESRMAGGTYAAEGIHHTVAATRAATDKALEENLLWTMREARLGGTTTIETKTGYGLTYTDELRAARIAAKHVDSVTFLGAHIVPQAITRERYLAAVTGEILTAVTPHVSAVDVFCDVGAFSGEETAAVLRSAQAAGLASHVHANQLGYGEGVQLAVAYGALSVDHVNYVTDADISLLAHSWNPQTSTSESTRGTVATVLPSCDLATRAPFAPARALQDAGVQLAIASNCNPGTAHSASMPFAVATAVLQMRLSSAEAVRAATLGGALALGIDRDGWCDPRGVQHAAVGRIRVGAQADLQMIAASSVTHLAYRPGTFLTAAVWKQGKRVV